MGSKEAKPAEMKKAAQRIVESPREVALLLQIVGDSFESGAKAIEIRHAGDNSVEWLCRGAPDERVGQGAGDWSTFAKVLLARANYWPQPRDHIFESYFDRKPRIVMNAKGALFSADLHVERRKEGGGTKVLFENVTWSRDDRLFRYFSLNEYNRKLFDEVKVTKTGIILANREPQKLSVDAYALMIAARPDALSFLNISSEDDAERALTLSRNHLVIIGLPAEDPIDLIFDLAALKKNPKLLEELYSRLRASLVHRRMKRACEHCALKVTVPGELVAKLPEVLRPTQVLETVQVGGCEQCRGTGIHGLVGIESGVLFSARLRDILLGGASPAQVTELAYREGVRSLLEDALDKHARRLCTFSEVLRCVTKISPAFLTSIASRSGNDSNTPFDLELQSKLNSMANDLFEKPNAAETSANPTQASNRSNATWLAPKSEGPGKPTVLIVEDDRDQREILELVLSTAGFEVFTATDGQDALSVLAKRSCTAIVCDLMMPIMSGEELVRELRSQEQYRHMPVLMFTAMDDDQRELDLLAAGADDYCRKTIRREILIERIKRLIARNTNPLSHFL